MVEFTGTIYRFTEDELERVSNRRWTILANQILGELSNGAPQFAYKTDDEFLSDAQITVNYIGKEVKRLQKALDPYGQTVYTKTKYINEGGHESYWGYFSYQSFPFEPQRVRKI